MRKTGLWVIVALAFVTAPLGAQTISLLVDSDFEASLDSAALRANSVSQDWYESRENAPTLLTLDSTNVGGNATKKAKLTATALGSAYLTQEFSSPQTQSLTAQWDIYVDSMWDRPNTSYDCGAWMFLGDDTGTTPDRIGPNAEDSERFVYLSFYKPGGGSSGTMDLIARERSDPAIPFTTVATGLSLKRWYTIKVMCNVAQGTYEVYVDGQRRATVAARTPKSSLTHITFAEWAQDEGTATFYVDNVMAAGNGPTGTTPGSGGTTPCACPAPSYDSGWVAMTSPSQSKTLTHNLGGNVDDYMVDLQLKRNNIAGQINITNRGIGQDFYYSNLTTQTITIVGPQQVGIDYAAWVRVRIWVCNCTTTSSSGGSGREPR